jgi:Flp pilus assembly protein TadB
MCTLPPNRFLLHFSTFDKEIRSPLEQHLSRVYRIVFLEFLQEKKMHKGRKKKAGHLLIVIAVVVVVPVVVAVVVTSFPFSYLFILLFSFSLPFKFKLSRAKSGRTVEF